MATHAQNVGIGNSAPTTALDVKGAIRTRPDSVFISQQYQVVDVSNTSFIRVDGNSAGIPGGEAATILLTPGKDGQHLRMESIGSNGNDQFAKLVSRTYLSNGKRILLAEDAGFVFTLKGRYIDLFYSNVTGWSETGRNIYSSVDVKEESFSSSGTFVVPIGITSINVVLWGAGGYGGGGTGVGGKGGFVAGTLAVNHGETLTIAVANGTGSNEKAGYCFIRRGANTILVLASGGGNGSNNGGTGGHAGQNGTMGAGATGGAGKGATVSAGGMGGTAGTGGSAGTNGASLSGGECNVITSAEGDGGNGYFGGGGSGTYSNLGFKASGGGGGGSNYTGGIGFTATHNTHTGNIVPAHPMYNGTGGSGGIGTGSGSPGRVIITW